MIEGYNIVCFCNDWDGDPLSKKQIVTRLAAKNRILWINSTGNRNPTASVHDLRRAWKKLKEFAAGCRAVTPNIHIFSPLVVPFYGSKLAHALNRRFFAACLKRTCRQLHFRDPIVLTFLPTSADVAGSLDARVLIYYCVDEYSQFSGTNRAAILEMEKRLIDNSGLVIVSARRLLETKGADNDRTFLIDHGVDVQHFRKACSAQTDVPRDFPPAPGPVIGFFGLVADWVDLPLIRAMALARPQWTFPLIGEVRTAIQMLQGLPNVHLLGRRPYQTLPGYCKAFDVAILPFVMNELTLSANPLKLREYLAAGLPVVATPIPEVRRMGRLVRLASTSDEYIAQIEALLAAGRRGPRLEDSLRMNAESWENKVDELSARIEACLHTASPRAQAVSRVSA